MNTAILQIIYFWHPRKVAALCCRCVQRSMEKSIICTLSYTSIRPLDKCNLVKRRTWWRKKFARVLHSSSVSHKSEKDMLKYLQREVSAKNWTLIVLMESHLPTELHHLTVFFPLSAHTNRWCSQSSGKLTSGKEYGASRHPSWRSQPRLDCCSAMLLQYWGSRRTDNVVP